MRILVAEPWLAGSHQSWAEGYRSHSSNDVEVLGLTAQLWRWRIRAGAVPLAELVRSSIRRSGQPDVLVVGGMVDVSSLLGMLRHDLRSTVPVVTYMHESQLLYPVVDGARDDEAVLRNWHSWCASDLVLFNSNFHRDSVIQAIPGWLARLPQSDQSQLWGSVQGRMDVLPVGVEPRTRPRLEDSGGSGPPVILWPHRWEPDKDPQTFARALDKLSRAGVDFRLILAGEDPSQSEVRSRLELVHSDRVLASGPFDVEEYRRWLVKSDIVVSCANHEFFGVAVMEAMLAGCVPVVPNALSYPELIPETWHDSVLYERGRFGSRLVDVVGDFERHKVTAAGLPEALKGYGWDHVARLYDNRLLSVVGATQRVESAPRGVE